MKGRRPGSKGNEWLMIKKHDEYVVEGYDIDEYDESVLSKRSLAEIAGDAGSAEWRSRPAGARQVEGSVAGGCSGKAGSRKKHKQADTEKRRGTQRTQRNDRVTSSQASCSTRIYRCEL